MIYGTCEGSLVTLTELTTEGKLFQWFSILLIKIFDKYDMPVTNFGELVHLYILAIFTMRTYYSYKNAVKKRSHLSYLKNPFQKKKKSYYYKKKYR